MTTAERAAALALAAREFAPWLGEITAERLLELVHLELGSAGVLDGFVPRGAHRSRAFPRSPLVHIMSGNTPHAALQSILRGLLLGGRQRVKLPAAGLPELAAFVGAMPTILRESVEIRPDLPDAWMAEAGAVVVFGGDETIASIHRMLRPDQVFVPHGHRVSLGVIFAEVAASLEAAAREASLFDQHGCLSPHGFYVAGDARAYAAGLAAAMAAFQVHTPRRALVAGEAAGIRRVRDDVAFRAALGEDIALWVSDGGSSTVWTVIFDGVDSAFTASCLDRVVYVKPLPASLATALASVSAHLGAVGYWPPTPQAAERLVREGLRASRLCPLGTMQNPPLTWHQDGQPVLAPLVRWIDVE